MKTVHIIKNNEKTTDYLHLNITQKIYH